MANATLEILRQRIALAKVSTMTLESARRIVRDTGLYGDYSDKMAESMRKEWVSDIAVERNRSILAKVRSDPDKAYLEWVALRAENPYHVTPRAVMEIADLYGHENAMRARDIVWPQEIAWARLFRTSKIDAHAWRAGIFLGAALAKPREVFLGVIELWFRRMGEDIGFGDMWTQSLKPEIIWPGRHEAPDDFVPTCILYTNEVNIPEAFAKVPEGIELAARAKKAKQLDMRDRRADAGKRYARDLEAARLYRDSSVARYAIGREFSSNEVIVAYDEFIGHVRRGAIEVDGTNFQHAFLRFLGEATVFLDDPTEVEKNDRIYEVLQIGSQWVAHLPNEILDLDGRSRENLEKWKNSIFEGYRQPPIEPIFDYYFFLYRMNQKMVGKKPKKLAST